MALRKIRHPAIVSYEGASADASGRLYLVMDFVEGPSLAQVVTQHPLNPMQVRALRRRLAEGLQAAHEQNVVHRDLSPDNIILRGGDLNQATIIDFGIARRTDAAKTSVIGKSFAGKVEYAAPEQFGMFTGTADARSDIYTLGLVLAAASLGYPLDMGSSAMAAIEARKKVPDLSRIVPELRPGLARMLEPDPARRLQSMREVAALDALDAAGGRSGGGLRVALLVGGLVLLAAVGAAFVFADPVAMVRSLFDPGATREAQDWRQATQADTVESYRAFLTRHPSGRYAVEARQRLTAAQQREGAQREEQAWRQAMQADTAVAYQGFLQRYPGSRHVAEARQRLAAVQQRETAGREEQAWREATQADTVAAYQSFLGQYPAGRYAAEARQRLAAVQQRDSGRRDEDELWRRAEGATTADPIREYLRRYPDGRYAEAARRKLAGMLSSGIDQAPQMTWSPTACAAIPLWVPSGFTCQVSSEFLLPGSTVRARSYTTGGTVGGWQTQVWMHQVVGNGAITVVAPAAQSLPQLSAFTQAGTDWSEPLAYGGAEYMTFRSGTANCVALRKPGTPRDSGYAYVFTAVQCAPSGQPLYPNDIRATIDGVRLK
jgi:outer membrane protein assembly factor BamD (BamD/ComL family)